jgi:hypothetical protein
MVTSIPLKCSVLKSLLDNLEKNIAEVGFGDILVSKQYARK